MRVKLLFSILKNKVFSCLCFSRFFIILMLRLASHPELPGYRAFVFFWNAFFNLFNTGLIYATEAPKKNLDNCLGRHVVLEFFGLAEGRPPQSAEKKFSVILLEEAPCLGVFWFRRGPPPKAPKKNLGSSV